MNNFKEGLSILQAIKSMWEKGKNCWSWKLMLAIQVFSYLYKITFKFYILVHDTGGSSEIIQTNSDCDDGCDENPLDVLLETMRTMDGM